MWRTLVLVVLLGAIGCSKTPVEPEPKQDPVDTQKRKEGRDKVINQGGTN